VAESPQRPAANRRCRARLDRAPEAAQPVHAQEHIRVLRNVNEQWDEGGGAPSVRYAAAGGVDPFAQRWGAGGAVLGEFVDVDALVIVEQKVHEELVGVEEGPAHRRGGASQAARRHSRCSQLSTNRSSVSRRIRAPRPTSSETPVPRQRPCRSARVSWRSGRTASRPQ
jgi:hypothetical protein